MCPKRKIQDFKENLEEEFFNQSEQDSNQEKEVLSKEKPNQIEGTSTNTKPSKKSKKEENLPPIISSQVMARSNLNSKWVGAHVSGAKGVFNSITNAAEIHGNSFAMFLKSQRQWNYTPYDAKVIEKFKELSEQYSYDWKHILPHGSYLINLGNPDEEKRRKSFDSFLDDLKRCEALNIRLYNFHPGSTVGECSSKDSIKYIAKCINEAHQKTENVITVIENMAGQGNVIGSSFEELADIIDKVEDKSRVGICLDTCHMFAAGYDIRTAQKFDGVLKKFEAVVGLQYLKALHLNDSKGDLGCKKDRHENIGKGKIGLECFRFIMNDDRFNGMPLVLETPVDDKNEKEIYSNEINLLYSFVESK